MVKKKNITRVSEAEELINPLIRYDIYHKTNGENPTVNPTKYISPISINSTTN
ncbi:chitobiase/beta-hexosaminidase C-terminal domain-containing protein [Clostridium butyricum]|uniref:chitobiase/beta-hexosaminidase C-terminal domain-containing protein n=1 Tax=Clostridium butyricum TaxID=1492 RepID=UPI000AB5B18B